LKDEYETPGLARGICFAELMGGTIVFVGKTQRKTQREIADGLICQTSNPSGIAK